MQIAERWFTITARASSGADYVLCESKPLQLNLALQGLFIHASVQTFAYMIRQSQKFFKNHNKLHDRSNQSARLDLKIYKWSRSRWAGFARCIGPIIPYDCIDTANLHAHLHTIAPSSLNLPSLAPHHPANPLILLPRFFLPRSLSISSSPTKPYPILHRVLWTTFICRLNSALSISYHPSSSSSDASVNHLLAFHSKLRTHTLIHPFSHSCPHTTLILTATLPPLTTAS